MAEDQTDEQKEADEVRRGKWGCLAVIAVGVAAVAMIVLLSSGGDDVATVTLNAAAQTDGLGNLYVTNNDAEPWIGVKLEINETYIRHSDSFSAGKEIKIPLYEFILDDGTRFNYVATKVLKLEITACVYLEGNGEDVLCPADFAWGYSGLVWN